MSPLGTKVASTKLDILDDIWWRGCFLTLILDIDDADYFLQSRHFSIEQEVFYILELGALLIDTNIYIIN
jgi:hypothetical protein